mmetsp:Transcript_2579/g.6742  ORF Transcript_2579/g.6742 Transcript_2579/m.6742 type:complete len:94 (-) Transcript_2579:585-866(-)
MLWNGGVSGPREEDSQTTIMEARWSAGGRAEPVRCSRAPAEAVQPNSVHMPWKESGGNNAGRISSSPTADKVSCPSLISYSRAKKREELEPGS